MDTFFYIILSVAALAFLFAVFLGKPGKDEPLKKDNIIWQKLDEHEKAIGE